MIQYFLTLPIRVYMATYVVDGQPYYFVNEIGQEKAEEIIAKRKGQSTDITEEPEGTYEDPKYEGFFHRSW